MWASLLLVGCVLVGQNDVNGDDDLRLEVRRLVHQLDAQQLARREAAENKLLQLGPNVLELLPQITDRTSAEVKQRLGRIRQKLELAAAEAVARPSLITLRGESLQLSKVLAALQSQSGNKIVDYRQRFGHEETDPALEVDFDKMPFWQALDQVLDQAELTVYPFGEERAIHVVHRGETRHSRHDCASYGGPFRFEPMRIVARRDLHEADAKSLQLTLSISWEPRLKPISLKQKMTDLRAVDENGNPLAPLNAQAILEAPAGEAASVELALPFELPPREVKEIASLKGKLLAMVAGKVQTFTFTNLKDAKKVQKRMAGVTVTLDRVRKNQALWEVHIRAKFDEAGEALESHRGWIFNNEAYLEDADGEKIEYDSLETTGQTKDGIGIAYLFARDELPNDFRFVYKTPGLIVTTAFDYEIKSVKLP